MTQNRREGVDYEIIPDWHDEAGKDDCVRFLQDPYTDIVVRYGQIKFGPEENPDGTLTAKFDYEIVQKPSSVSENILRDDRKFNQILGEVMISILELHFGMEPNVRELEIRDVDSSAFED